MQCLPGVSLRCEQSGPRCNACSIGLWKGKVLSAQYADGGQQNGVPTWRVGAGGHTLFSGSWTVGKVVAQLSCRMSKD
jgi:hypothetical protein